MKSAKSVSNLNNMRAALPDMKVASAVDHGHAKFELIPACLQQVPRTPSPTDADAQQEDDKSTNNRKKRKRVGSADGITCPKQKDIAVQRSKAAEYTRKCRKVWSQGLEDLPNVVHWFCIMGLIVSEKNGAIPRASKYCAKSERYQCAAEECEFISCSTFSFFFPLKMNSISRS